MVFLAPSWLFLLIPIFAALWLSHRQLLGMARARKRLATGIRAVLATLLVLALAQPQSARANRGVATVIVLDRSDSIPESARKKQEEFVQSVFGNLGEDDVAGVVVTGAESAIETIVAGRRPFGQVLSKIDPRGTDLSAAIRLASASFPEGKGRRIVLLTDGNETQGDLVAAAEVAATEGISIDFVPLETEKPGEALVASLEAPTQHRVGEPLSLRTLVESSVDQTGTLRLERNGNLVGEKTVRLPAGKSAVVFTDRFIEAGFYQYRLSLRADKDVDLRNNVAGAFVSAQNRPRVLLLQSRDDKVLETALKVQGVDVDVRLPGAIPTRPAQLQSYAGIIFNDLNAVAMTPQQMSMVQQAVRDTGIGLAMIGGEESFLPGGWYGTPIAEALPVDLNIRNRKSFPSTSILILIDASGSMSMIEDGVQKIRLAAQAAEYTVKLLSPADRVGVGGSSDGLEMVAPMQQLTDKEAVIAQVRRLSTGGGGIYIGATVQKAEEMMMSENSKVRHFILLADGNDSEDPQDAVSRVLRMRANKITTTVVSIGDGQDVPLLKNLAAAGGGRFFMAKRASQLPAIFTQDTAMVARSAIEEGEFYPELMGGDEMLRGISATPSLLAYCLSELKPLARLQMRTPKKDPLLASWQYGLGTSVAFTSDAHARWAGNWVPWGGFKTFWAQVVRNLSRRNADNGYQVTLDTGDGKPTLKVQAEDRFGSPRTDWDGKMRIGAPDGSSFEVALTQTAPGQYEAPFDKSLMGSYMATVAEQGPAGKAVSVTGFSIAYPPEFRALKSSTMLLQRAAEVSGGKGIAKPDEALRPMARPGEARSDLWRSLLFAALGLLLVDVGVRRIAIPFGEMLAKARAWVTGRRSTSRVVREERLERASVLKQAKERAAKARPTPPTPTMAASRSVEDFGESLPASRQAPVQPPAESPAVAPRPTTPASASSRLLERKRERQEKSDD